MRNEPLTGAMIGCGRIVQEHHIPAWQAIGRDAVRNWTVADGSYESRLHAQLAMGISNDHAYKDHRALLIRERPDFAVVATPHVSHEQIVKDFLNAGVPVLVEKPMATTVPAATRMVEAADRAGVPLVVIHNYVARPQTATSHRLLEEGAIGRPFLFRAEALGMGWSRGVAGYDPDWRTNPEVSGGGCLLDNAYHGIYMAQSLLGEITSVFARVTAYNRSVDVDDTALLLLTHADGGTSSIQAAWSLGGQSRAVNELYGTEGTMRLEPDGVVAISRDNDEWERHPSVAGAGFRRVFRNFLDVITGTGKPYTTAEGGLATLRVVRAAYASAERGEAIALADFEE